MMTESDQWRRMIAQSFSPRQWFEDEDNPNACHYEEKTMWVYREQGGQFEVGYYGPDRAWFLDATYGNREAASRRVHYLNGGPA